MNKIADNAISDFSADLAALRQDLASLAETVKTLMQHQAHVASQKVTEAVGEASSKIASKAADVEGQVRAASHELEAKIEQNPFTAVLIAFGTGIVLGLLTRSRG